jgi:hypothetical protein
MKIEIQTPTRDKAVDTIVTSPKWYAAVTSPSELFHDIYCEEDRLYFIDGKGDVHYFRYLGKNLALGESEGD